MGPPSSGLCLLIAWLPKSWAGGWGGVQHRLFPTVGLSAPRSQQGRRGRLTRFLNLPPHQEAVAVQLEPERLIKILEVLGELPLPNYRCVGFLPPQRAAPRPTQPWGVDLSLPFRLPDLNPTPALGVPCVTPGPQCPPSAGPWSSSRGTWCTWPRSVLRPTCTPATWPSCGPPTC